jgi:hypothetical protein
MLLPTGPWSRPGSHGCKLLGIALEGDVDTLPSLCMYSIPELAMIGMTEEQA